MRHPVSVSTSFNSQTLKNTKNLPGIPKKQMNHGKKVILRTPSCKGVALKVKIQYSNDSYYFPHFFLDSFALKGVKARNEKCTGNCTNKLQS